MRRLFLLAASILFIANTVSLAADGGETKLRIATDGAAAVPIVVSDKASAITKSSAAELAEYLKRITGAAFEIKTGDGSAGIVLGTLAEFPDPALAAGLEIRNTYDGKEAYSIRTDAKRVRLIGATELGAKHAAVRFLELLGCRWFFPAREWEVIPAARTLDFSANETSRPAILARRIWYGYAYFPDDPQTNEPRAFRDYEAWTHHNRMGGSFNVNAGHAWQTIISERQKDFDAHPEYLALVKGKRQEPQMCVSSPAVRKISLQYAQNYLRKNPNADMVSMETSDGGGHCECDACLKLGNISDRVFGLANEVAREIGKEFPGKMIGLYAYNDHCEPPTFELESNVYVQSTAGFVTGRYTFDELLDVWPKKSRNIGFYDYYSVWLWDFDRLPGGRAADIGYLRKQIPRYFAKGATSLDCESGNNWGPHGRGYYLTSKLAWDPKCDVDAILADFYEKAFGPAAGPMKRHYERLDPSSKPLMSKGLLGLAFRDIAEATQLAKDSPDVLARLDHLKQYLRYIHLRWQIDRDADIAKKKDLTLAALTHCYRTRYSYMNHWEAMRQDWTANAAKEFNEPTWSFNDPSGKQPWKVATAKSSDETQKEFGEGLTFFQPLNVEEKTFSADLVPVTFNASNPPAESRQSYQNPAPYALYSIAGEPLSLDVTTGTIAWYRDRAPARYTLRDTSGKTLFEARLPLDGKPHHLELKVPAAGLYYFDFDDTSAGWQIAVPAGRPVSILLQRDAGVAHAGWMQTIYFYVPKGTKQIQYFWEGNNHQVIGPDGKLRQEVKTSGEVVSIPVPDGMDGKPWALNQIALGHLWFFNAPNQVAASPAALLIPKDVAQRDGLVE